MQVLRWVWQAQIQNWEGLSQKEHQRAEQLQQQLMAAQAELAHASAPLQARFPLPDHLDAEHQYKAVSLCHRNKPAYVYGLFQCEIREQF